MKPFVPLLPGGHLSTIAANFWPRRLDERRYPVESRLFHTQPDVSILVEVQRPENPRGEVVLVHGLEGSSRSAYMCSLAQTLLHAGFVVHRTNIRTCGGTDFKAPTLYHAGLTSDLLAYLLHLDEERRTPVWLAGFSLGGNQVLKLAGELGPDAPRLLRGVCGVSTPIDLAACARRLGEPDNRLYQWWFLSRMKRRLLLRQSVMGDSFPVRITPAEIRALRTIYELDDRVTGPAFNFRGADHYYETQSAARSLHAIRIPTLLVIARNDPLVPFDTYTHPFIGNDGPIQLVAPGHGGHIGFLARRRPRLWVDQLIREWIEGTIAPSPASS